METFRIIANLVLIVGGGWCLVDRWRQAGRDLEAWERAEAMRRANEYVERHEVPRSNHPFR